MRRLLTLAGALLVVAACGETSTEPSGELLAEVEFGAGGSGYDGDTVTAPSGAVVCLGYEPFETSVNRSYPVGDTLLGCDRTYSAGGPHGPIMFRPGDPGFAPIIQRLTDGNDETLWTIYLAVDDALGVTQPIGGATGEQESQAFTEVGVPDLAGSTVDSIALVITSIDASREDAGPGLWLFSIGVAGTWRFWGRRGG